MLEIKRAGMPSFFVKEVDNKKIDIFIT